MAGCYSSSIFTSELELSWENFIHFKMANFTNHPQVLDLTYFDSHPIGLFFIYLFKLEVQRSPTA